MADCPAPPNWRPITGKPALEVTMAANLAIEEAYRTEKGDHGVLFGSQFEEGFLARGVQREIRLPDRAPNKEFGNHLLKELRGLKGGPRKPDIVDFNDRAFYEIKPVRTFEKYRQKTINQHLSLYRMAESIVDDFNNEKRARTPVDGKTLAIEYPWSIENAKWKPPSCLTLPGLKGIYKLDTFKTDYDTDRNCRGIIIYRVWKKVRRREEEKEHATQVAVVDRDQKYDKLIPAPTALRKAIGRYNLDEPEHVIIVPKHINDLLSKRSLIDLTQSLSKPSSVDVRSQKAATSQPSMLSRVGSLAAHHPYLTAGAIVAVAATGYGLFVYLGAGATAAAGGGGGAALAEGGGAEIISLTARRLVVQGAAEVAKKAAAVLIFFGVVKSVRADEVSFSSVETMKAIPVSSIAPYKSTYSALSNGMCIADAPQDFSWSDEDVCVGDQVMYDSEPHSVVATLTAFPNNVWSDE